MSRRRVLGSLGGVVAAGPVVLGVLPPGTPAAGGDPAPDLTLRTERGPLRLADQQGKVVVLYFSFPG